MFLSENLQLLEFPDAMPHSEWYSKEAIPPTHMTAFFIGSAGLLKNISPFGSELIPVRSMERSLLREDP